METNITHWTNDPDLVSEFVLKRLDRIEHEALQSHLDNCANCLGVVLLEMEVMSGAKQAGRDQLKGRLHEQIRNEEASWFQRYQMISLAAAVLAILIGLGIFRLYFGSIEWPTKFSSSRYVIKRGSTDSLNGKVENGTPHDKESGQEPYADNHHEGENSAGEISEAASRREREAESAAEVRESGRGIWLIGKVIMISETNGEDEELANEVIRDRGQVSSKSVSFSEDRIITIQKKGVSQMVILRQLPLTSLPRLRVEIAMTQAPHEVQTLVKRTPKGLNLTLYRDTLVASSQFRKATVNPVTEDSIIVAFANQRIAYHIPGGWGAHPSTKPSLGRRQ